MSYGNGPPFGGPPPPGDPGPPPGYGSRPTAYDASNPYRAPGEQDPAMPGAIDPPGSGLKWVYVGGHAAYWLFAVGGVLLAVVLTSGRSDGGEAATMATKLPLAGVVFLLAALLAATFWLHMAWTSVPPSMRCTHRGRWITPGQAAGYMFIPFYNVYWMFVANQGLCEVVDRTLLAQGALPRAPRGMATAACVAQLIPYCNLLVAPILWAIYMFKVDGARREMLNPRR